MLAMRRSVTILLWGAVAAYLGCYPTYGQETLADITESARRLSVLSHLKVTFRLEESLTPSISPEELEKLTAAFKAKSSRTAGLRLETGTRAFDCLWTRLDDRVRFERRATEGTRKEFAHVDPLRITSVYDGRTDILMPRETQGELAGAVMESIEYPESLIDIALGVRLQDSPRLLTVEDLALFKVTSKTDGLWTAERTNGSRRDVWDVSTERGFMPVKYRVIVGGDTCFTTEVTDFRKEQDVWLPNTVKLAWTSSENGDTETNASTVLNVASIEFKAQDVTPESFAIVFPNNTDVHEARIDRTFAIRDGAETLSDEKIKSSIKLDIKSPWRGWVLIGNACAIAIIIAVVLYRRARSRNLITT